jgi:ABC-type spermidine/putrescine transport system permease subunit II
VAGCGTPEINAISTIIVAVTAVTVLSAWRVGRYRADRVA